MAIVSLLVFSKVQAQDPEYRAQSLYIYKFSRYIFWPENTLQGNFRIGVFGNSPIQKELEVMASLKKAANNMDFEVRDVDPENDDLSQFHIIYVSSSKSRQIGQITESVGQLPVLIVAEREGMASRGATLSFIVLENGVLKFEINMEMLRNQQLDISDELLKLGFEI